LNTPGDGRWDDGIDTPVAMHVKRTRLSVAGTGTKGANLTVHDQEKVALHYYINSLYFRNSNASLQIAHRQPQKENFNIKLCVHFLKECLAQLSQTK
jgi:hypothetical protein